MNENEEDFYRPINPEITYEDLGHAPREHITELRASPAQERIQTETKPTTAFRFSEQVARTETLKTQLNATPPTPGDLRECNMHIPICMLATLSENGETRETPQLAKYTRPAIDRHKLEQLERAKQIHLVSEIADIGPQTHLDVELSTVESPKTPIEALVDLYTSSNNNRANDAQANVTAEQHARLQNINTNSRANTLYRKAFAESLVELAKNDYGLDIAVVYEAGLPSVEQPDQEVKYIGPQINLEQVKYTLRLKEILTNNPNEILGTISLIQ